MGFGTSAIRRMAGEALKDIDDEDSARSKDATADS